MPGPRGRTAVLLALAGLAAAAAALLALLALPGAAAITISSAGPLIDIHISSVGTLDCQVQVQGVTYAATGAESDGEFWGFTNGNPSSFPDGPPACGTFLWFGGAAYGPNVGGWTIGGNPPPTPFTLVGQSGVTGTGTDADPHTVVTTVTASPLVQLVQTDQYVVGLGRYRTTMAVTNNGPSQSFMLYRAADCYLEDNANFDDGDQGYGWRDAATHAVGCTFAPNVLGHHFQAWLPVSMTAGTLAGQEQDWTSQWTRASAGQPYLDSCVCPIVGDNGAGLSWSFPLGTGESATFVMDNAFLPEPVPPPPPPPPVPPVAGFSFLAANTCQDTRVTFTDLSTDDQGVVSWLWEFGDAATATTPGAIHGYGPAGGTFTVRLTVTDAGGLSDWTEQVVTALPDRNCCPGFEAVADHTIREGDLLRLRVRATDLDGDPLTYGVSGTVPAPYYFDPQTGLFEWQTDAEDAGLYTVAFVASDAECSATESVNVLVRDTPEPAPIPDADMDGVADPSDNCPAVANRAQADADRDGTGDACDESPCGANGPDGPPGPCPAGGAAGPAGAAPGAPDADGDGVPDASDLCPAVPDAGQADLDLDGVGDLCDADRDGDGVLDAPRAGIAADNCLLAANPSQADADGDGVGDACGQARSREIQAPRTGEGAAAPGLLAGAGWLGLVAAAAALPAALLVWWAARRRDG